ncbi:MAG: hypothetical protein ACYDDA_13445 [Acidiferrobacteraceae bacterium]
MFSGHLEALAAVIAAVVTAAVAVPGQVAILPRKAVAVAVAVVVVAAAVAAVAVALGTIWLLAARWIMYPLFSRVEPAASAATAAVAVAVALAYMPILPQSSPTPAPLRGAPVPADRVTTVGLVVVVVYWVLVFR